MKILMINKFLYPNGGSETYMIELGKYFESLGYKVQYFGMFDERNILKNVADSYANKIEFHSSIKNPFKLFNTFFETIYSKNARRKLKKVLIDFKPDIVHMNNINFQLTPSIIYELKKYKIPIVQTVHDVQIACPCHRFYIEHKEEICTKCKEGAYYNCILNKCVHNSMLKSFLASLESYYYHSRNTYNLVDSYICPSKFIAEQITNAGIKQEKITVLHNFSKKEKKLVIRDCSNKYALYFGRLSKEKGLETILSIAKKLSNIKFVIAGNGPLEDKVIEISSEYDNIEFVGFKTGIELQKLIINAAFSLYPSEWYENCPLSVIESIALGTPVIGSDLGGTKELIANGKTGLIFEGCNNEQFSKAIQELWNNEELLVNMREQCLQSNFNPVSYTHLTLPTNSLV